MQFCSIIILVLSLAVGFISSTVSSLEHLYAQEDTPSEDLQQLCPPGTGPDPDGGCSPLPDEAIEESTPEGSDFTTQLLFEQDPGPPVEVVGPFKNFIPNINVPDINFPDVKKIIEEPAKEITGSLENTLSTINPNIPVSTLMIVGVVAVIAIGAGVASFSRHHHGRSSTSHSSQDQTQRDDTEEEQIYEDVQIVTKGGIEEV